MASLSIWQKRMGRTGWRGDILAKYFIRPAGRCQIAGLPRVLQRGVVLGAWAGRERDVRLRRMDGGDTGFDVHQIFT